MIHYLWWVPACCVAYGMVAFLSIKSKEVGGIWFWLLWIPIPLWALITRVSNNLLFDGILYDFVLVTSFSVGMIILGASEGFKITQYVGMGLAIGGLVLMRV